MNRVSILIGIAMICVVLSALAISGSMGPMALKKDQDRLSHFLTACRTSKMTIEETVKQASEGGWKVTPTPEMMLLNARKTQNPTFFLSGTAKYENLNSKRVVRATVHGNGTLWTHKVYVTLSDES